MRAENIDRRATLGLAFAGLVTPAQAQPRFPDRPIRIYVPFPPGGTTDIQMRALVEAAGRRLGQPIIIENRPGAGGSLGATALAQGTRPDGYTLSVMPNSIFRIPAMMARPPYDPMVDFTWIIRMVGYTFGIVVRADAPWQSLQELLADARANPGKITYGTPGVATLDVTMEMIAQRAGGIQWVHVPFRGGADNIQALLAGQISVSAESSVWAELEERFNMPLLYADGEAYAAYARQFYEEDSAMVRAMGLRF